MKQNNTYLADKAWNQSRSIINLPNSSQDTNNTLAIGLVGKLHYRFLPGALYSSYGFIVERIDSSSEGQIKLY